MRLEPRTVPQGRQVSRAADAIWHPSPNFGERRDGLRPTLIVLHYTAMQTAREALDRLCDPEHEVSAHYLISERGDLWQLVDESRRAWHAGAGSWAGAADINSRSIGIELANDGQSPFAAPMMDRLEALLLCVMERWKIPATGVIGHSDMAPDRKTDPGPRFDWRRLARQGLAIAPQPDAPAPEEDADRFRADAMRFGYPDMTVETILPAFRARFRPGALGPLDRIDMQLVSHLADQHAVDRSAALA